MILLDSAALYAAPLESLRRLAKSLRIAPPRPGSSQRSAYVHAILAAERDLAARERALKNSPLRRQQERNRRGESTS